MRAWCSSSLVDVGLALVSVEGLCSSASLVDVGLVVARSVEGLVLVGVVDRRRLALARRVEALVLVGVLGRRRGWWSLVWGWADAVLMRVDIVMALPVLPPTLVVGVFVAGGC